MVEQNNLSEIIVAPMDFQLIEFHSSKAMYSSYLFMDIKKFDSLILLKSKKFFRKLPLNLNDIFACCLISSFIRLSMCTEQIRFEKKLLEIKSKIKNEFDIQGFVNGYEILNLSTLTKHWISYIDLQDIHTVTLNGPRALLIDSEISHE